MPATAEATHTSSSSEEGAAGTPARCAPPSSASRSPSSRRTPRRTCLHRGCIPTKALLHAAEVADAAREAGRFGVRRPSRASTPPAVTAYREGVVGRLHKGLQGLVSGGRSSNVEGTGRLDGPHTVVVGGDRRLVGRHVVLARHRLLRPHAARARARRPRRDERTRPSPRRGPRPRRRPRGGVIGVEFASVMRSFGSEVTVVEALPGSSPPRTPPPARRSNGPSASAASRSAPAPASPRRRRRRRRHRPPRGRHRARGRPAPSSPSGAARHRRPGLRGGRRHGRARLRRHRRAAAAPASRACGRSATSSPAAARAPRVRPGHLRRGVEIAGLEPAPVVESTIPRVTYCDPEVASVASPRSRPARSTATRRGLRVQPRRQRQEPDPRHPGLRQARPGHRRPRRRGPHGRLPDGRAGRRGPARRGLEAHRRTSRPSCTPTRPRTRPSARRTWRSPASPCTRTTRVMTATAHEGEHH